MRLYVLFPFSVSYSGFVAVVILVYVCTVIVVAVGEVEYSL
jgi:hypothetical protein